MTHRKFFKWFLAGWLLATLISGILSGLAPVAQTPLTLSLRIVMYLYLFYGTVKFFRTGNVPIRWKK